MSTTNKTMAVKEQPATLAKDANNTIGTPNMETAAGETPKIVNNVPMPLQIALDSNVADVEFNGVVSTTEEEKTTAIRQYIRNKVLNQFGVVEVTKNSVTGGKLYFNGNRTNLKLPKVDLRANGSFAESLPAYYNRIKPELQKWLLQSVQNSAITMEMVGEIA